MRLVVSLVLFFCVPLSAAAQKYGQIDGRVSVPDGQGIGGVTATAAESGAVAITDAEGRYSFSRVLPGTYTLSFRLGEHVTAKKGIVVEPGSRTWVEMMVDWAPAFAETLTVVAASRRAERAVESPAATSILLNEEIARQGAHGQLPKLLASTPGVELVQSGLYDFNINARGFNTAINRRVLTLIDGRDPSTPAVLGYQEWATLGLPLDELESVELVRGPTAALYGAGAVNGVLALTTKAPQDSQGGQARFTIGEPEARRFDFRHAGAFRRNWYFKLLGGYEESEDLTRSRVTDVEYEPERLPREVIPPPQDRTEIAFGDVRLDRELDEARTLMLEAGTTTARGVTTVTSLGRSQAGDVRRPWGRFRFVSPRWSVLAYHTGRDASNLRGLGSGSSIYLNESNSALEIEGNTPIARGRGFLIGGASYRRQRANSMAPMGRHTVFARSVEAEQESIFGQLELPLGQHFKGILSGRLDDSTLQDLESSLRAGLVYSPKPNHTFRLTYSTGFQSPTLVEMFLATDVAPMLDLSAIERALGAQLGGVALHFESIPLLAVGNENLVVEDVNSLEAGYSGILGNNIFLSLSYYRNRLQNFATNLLPQLGTSLGRINANYDPYVPPVELSPEVAALVLATLQGSLPPHLFVLMSNNSEGLPIFVILSFTNFGRAETEGFEAGLTWTNQTWRLDAAYSHFDLEVQAASREVPLLANAPENQASLAVSYVANRWDASLVGRWVEDYEWLAGIYRGPIPSHIAVDLAANWRFTSRWEVGLNVSNLLGDVHYEIFGGDLLRRRALTYVQLSW